MPRSTAKFAASCFAVLACLLCFSAAPVAGQDAGRTKPAASPPVSSPSPAPVALPTPIPIQITVTTAPAPSPAVPASGMTAADWKAIMIAVLPNLIGLGTAIWVALFVTRKTEQERLKSQEETERQRMEFQKEAELQKQRMELFKLLYIERLSVAKKISEMHSALHDKIIAVYYTDFDTAVKDVHDAFSEAVLFSNANIWLIPDDVRREIKTMYELCKAIIFGSRADTLAEQTSIISKLAALSNKLVPALSEMMLNDDLSKIVAKQTAVTAEEGENR